MSVLSAQEILDWLADPQVADLEAPSSESEKHVAKIWPIVESRIKLEIGRPFEEADHTDEIFTLENERSSFLLPDRPIGEWTSLDLVTAWSEADGNVSTSETIARNLYRIDAGAGLVLRHEGDFAAGTYIRTYKAGYAAAQITGDQADEIPVFKKLALILIERELKMVQDGRKRHIASISDEAGSVRYQVDMTKDELRVLDLLRLKGR